MIFKKDPGQNQLFDVFESILSPLAYTRLLRGWQGVFRHVILALMPVDELGKSLSKTLGAPTKELYSIAGLILIMEFKNWTREEAVDAYLYDASVQFALNLDPAQQTLCTRTIERYQTRFREEDLAADLMANLTARLAECLELDVSKQRLDSTHVHSDMAIFSRLRLMGVAIRRFLTQVKRHDLEGFHALPEEFRQRYAQSEGLLFADVKGAEGHRLMRQQVAEDMHALIARFERDEAHCQRSTFQAMTRIFHEQCEVVEERITIKTTAGGRVMQNPSDPDATYDGYKGPGYQVQVAETTSAANEVQLITGAMPQTAADSDAQSVTPMLDLLDESGLAPKELQADKAYGSDSNEQALEARGVELVSPTQDRAVSPHGLNVDDFAIDERSDTPTVECCPAGHAPKSSGYDARTQSMTVVMSASHCAACPFAEECPVRPRRGGNYEVTFTMQARRLEGRRREQETEAFRERYRKRSGIESTNSSLKRVTGLGRLRVRGSPAVFTAILLKIAGWNILRAAASSKMRRLVAAFAQRGGIRGILAVWARFFDHPTWLRSFLALWKRQRDRSYPELVTHSNYLDQSSSHFCRWRL